MTINDNSDIFVFAKIASTYEVLDCKNKTCTNIDHPKEIERELIKKSQSGDKRAKDKLVKHNFKLIISIAKKYINQGLTFQDLIQEGSIGCNRSY